MPCLFFVELQVKSVCSFCEIVGKEKMRSWNKWTRRRISITASSICGNETTIKFWGVFLKCASGNFFSLASLWLCFNLLKDVCLDTIPFFYDCKEKKNLFHKRKWVVFDAWVAAWAVMWFFFFTFLCSRVFFCACDCVHVYTRKCMSPRFKKNKKKLETT